MAAKIQERNKKPGVCYALTDDGMELPVVDITHPAFALEMTETEISAVIDRSLQAVRDSAKLPSFVLNAVMGSSLVLRGLAAATAGSYLSALTTYLLRLGPENLGEGYANDLDRKVASTILPVGLRFRLRDMAQLLARALAPAVSVADGRTLELLSIAGGPAMDCLNALLLIRKEHPDWLAGREIRIHILDIDSAMPAFGIRALAELSASGAPLAGLAVSAEFVPFDWNQTDGLRAFLARLPREAIVAASAEGGLLSYAADETIVGNLRALAEETPADFFLVGSIAPELGTLDPRIQDLIRSGRGPAVRYLGLDLMRRLAEQSGLELVETLDSLVNHVTLFRKRCFVDRK